ncbi:MAG TPA: 30S ribosomal protein S6 [Candidatus Dormibacteraeota bacterium]|nr:30S ribosomal protein S6 [Candidatus Dormibacteraeota bacterium]
MRDYELMYIVRPELDDEGLQGAVESVETLVTGLGGTVVRTTNWGRRRLAYEVDHLRDGHYMLLHIRLDGARVADLERALAIHETVFRHLLVVREGADEAEAEADAEPEAATASAPATTPDGAAESPTARQPVVAAPGDDDSAVEDDNDDDQNNADDGPAELVAAAEEEN